MPSQELSQKVNGAINRIYNLIKPKLPWYLRSSVAKPLISAGTILSALGLLLPFFLPLSFTVGAIFLLSGVIASFATLTYSIKYLAARDHYARPVSELLQVPDTERPKSSVPDNKPLTPEPPYAGPSIYPLKNKSSIDLPETDSKTPHQI